MYLQNDMFHYLSHELGKWFQLNVALLHQHKCWTVGSWRHLFWVTGKISSLFTPKDPPPPSKKPNFNKLGWVPPNRPLHHPHSAATWGNSSIQTHTTLHADETRWKKSITAFLAQPQPRQTDHTVWMFYSVRHSPTIFILFLSTPGFYWAFV